MGTLLLHRLLHPDEPSRQDEIKRSRSPNATPPCFTRPISECVLSPGSLYIFPGTDLTEQRSHVALILTNIIFVIGILVFAVLLGMVGEEVSVSMW